MNTLDRNPLASRMADTARSERIGRIRNQMAANDLVAALREIETICTESAADCRKRMGTRVGNILVVARAAIAKVEAPR